jgi:predicted Zn-dependent peptidase
MEAKVSTLENGIRVVTDTVDSVETVSLGIWNFVGARNEPENLNGISHLIEHMVFKGTKNRSALQIVSEIEEKGGFLNAYTSREVTAYYAKILKEDAPLALDIISDMLVNPTFPEKEFVKEKEVVIQEIKQSFDSPDEYVFDILQEKMFPDQPLGRQVLGTQDTVKSITRENLYDYMEQNYVPQNMVVSASGKIEHSDLVALVEEKLGHLKRREFKKPENSIYHGGYVTQKRDIEQVNVCIGFEGVSFDAMEYYSASVFSMLFGGGMTSRLFQEIRENRGLVYSVYSYVSSRQDGGVFGIYAGTGKKEVKELVPAICLEIKRAIKDVSQEEVERAKTQLKASLLMALESTSTRCEQAARQMLIYDRPLPVYEITAKVEAVTKEDVLNVAKKIFSSKPTLAANGPVEDFVEYDEFQALLK